MSSRFSVSMCVYAKDNPAWFQEAVNSILNQSIAPNEIVLVVDGPVPEKMSQAILQYEANSLFKVIRFEKNQGHGVARRAGLDSCSNELVAIMDADDISLPDRFEKELSLFESDPGIAVAGGQITEFIGDPENIIAKRIVPVTDAEIKQFMKKRCPMNLVSVIVRKSAVKAAGGFIDWFCEEDYYLWLRMALAGMRFANVEDVVVNCRVGKEMYKRRGGLEYFKSEKKLQKFMLENKVINLGTYSANIIKRFIVEVLLPAKIRGWAYKRFARG